MDLIGSLGSQLGLSETQAQALAGTVLGGIRGQLADADGEEEAAKMDQAVPELGGWAAMAGQFLNAPDTNDDSDEGGLGGLLGDLAGAAAGGGALGQAFEAFAGKEAKQTAQVVALLDKFGIGGDKVALVAPLAMDFLKDRLPADLIDKALSFAPMLLGAGASPEPTPEPDTASKIAGALGGLFGS